ncbi:TPA: hypothetical protein I8V79_000917 [Corynebacterium striatum]|nr:hypothetical protein [Corynebacterium striatum]HAT1319532.1 hypothetical protein [Corynebacterium striatum]HAT1418870.1 hypothetical protein [Corynebacterium striatum]HAT6642467.1 hypothetical protein [Corynebacterium striatum]
MEWWTSLTGVLSQAMVQAPVWVQMSVLIVIAVPLLAIAAWCLMFVIDFVGRPRFRGAATGSEIQKTDSTR